MLSTVVRLAIRRSGVVMAVALLLLAYGGYRIKEASLDIFPEFAAKRVVIQTEAPGLSPEQVEKLVTLPLERSLAGLLGLLTIRSESLQGLSVVTLVFDEDTDVYRNRQMVNERLTPLQGLLPPGIGPPVTVPLSSSSATVLTLGLESESLSLMDLRSLVDWNLVPRLLSVPGVADVNVFGGDVRQLQVQIDPNRLRRLGLGLNEVLLAAQQATGMRGAGFVENDNQRISLQVTGLPDAAESLRDVVLARKDGVNVTLGDVAEVKAAPRVPISAAAIGGRPGIVMMVIGQYQANTLRVSRDVEAVLKTYEPLLAKQGIRLHPHLFRPADYIERSLSNLAGHLLIGGVLVLVILYLFLFDWRAAFISALAIPLSLLGATLVLLQFGVNLNIMVLGGLAIALGEVVDDAIIDTENIFRRLRENRSASHPRSVMRVVYAASMEVRGSVVYASFIVSLAFVPLLSLNGVAGRLFAPLGEAYILAILASLAVALSVTPALCYLILGQYPGALEAPPLIRRMQPGYQRLLLAATARPQETLVLGAIVCCAGLVLAPTLGGSFLPELREGHYIVHTSSITGTSLAESLRTGGRLTETFLKIPGVESVSQWAGRAERGADTYGSHYSEYEVRLAPLSGAGQQAVLDRLRALLNSFPGLLYEANTFLTERIDETISGYTSPVVINLYGDDLGELDAKAREVLKLMQAVRGAADAQLRSPTGAPLLQVRLRPERLAAVGLRPLEAAEAVQIAYDGRVVGRYFENSRTHDVSVILAPTHRQQVESVARLPLKTPDGVMLSLGDVADIQQIGDRYNILHLGAQRVQTITCQVQGRDMDGFIRELRERVVHEVAFPPGMYPEFTGAAVEQSTAKRALIVQALLAGAGILILTYLALGSLRNTLLTLVNLPFALVGGVLGALMTGSALSVGSMVGFVTLFGITLRNAIMLVSHYRHLVEREHRAWDLDTLVLGARQRLPSILMTALVTALAMLPIAVNSDNPGREIMGPMAAIIVGGLTSSTALNLLVLPAVLWRWGSFAGEDRGGNSPGAHRSPPPSA
ncbi:efflux RND transporter permease subunit [Methyloterricola oryzae]|uniref:efflux RND transporter permease subunit n=1 Tax=Methyloterricola oryzae TaxID=1495050 RepID=UPI0005EBBCDB|nr:efflux RND transporter permease subunit [Methyloterricola oryzae]